MEIGKALDKGNESGGIGMKPEDLICLRRVVMESKEEDWVS